MHVSPFGLGAWRAHAKPVFGVKVEAGDETCKRKFSWHPLIFQCHVSNGACLDMRWFPACAVLILPQQEETCELCRSAPLIETFDFNLYFLGNTASCETHCTMYSLAAVCPWTWLILPVVICLSQRLSHACLSISFHTAKLQMAHYNSCDFFEGHCLLG